MKNNLPLIAASLLAISALPACQAETINGGETANTQANETAQVAPVELPPMLAASKTYRCKDGSLVYIDYMNDSKTANYAETKGGTPTVLKAAEAGQPYIAEGYSLTGAPDTAAIELTTPKGSQSCKA